MLNVRKPKFRGKKTKWEIAREKRPAKRQAQGKKPLAEPLTIAPAAERQAALKKGKMVFYDGQKRIVTDLIRLEPTRYREEPSTLQGIFKLPDGSFVEMRSDNYSNLMVWKVEVLKDGSVSDLKNIGFFSKNVGNIGHMKLPELIIGVGLGLKGASKAERHVRSLREFHDFVTRKRFERLFERLHYQKIEDKPDMQVFGKMLKIVRLRKQTKNQPKDNLNKYHRIEAIDPKTGKARIFTFPVTK